MRIVVYGGSFNPHILGMLKPPEPSAQSLRRINF